jgi:carboxymethylenebutenolidase
MIDVTTQDGVADAYLARPGGQRRPGVLLMMDAFRQRPQIERMADRIAAAGYVVLAPNHFYRAGRAPVVPLDGLDDPERRSALFEQLRPLMAELTPERVARDGDAYLDALAEVADGPVAITGYCMGGRVGWRIATTHPDRVAALAGFHVGGLDGDGADRLRGEVYLGYADNDRNATPEQVAAVDAALDEAGVPHRSEVYAGAAHGYTMADTPAYDAGADERHYRELLALLDRRL